MTIRFVSLEPLVGFHAVDAKANKAIFAELPVLPSISADESDTTRPPEELPSFRSMIGVILTSCNADVMFVLRLTF